MSAKCSQCAAPTIWDDEVGSALCTSCGSLVDPSQSVLTTDSVEASVWHVPASTTLKSLRSGNNWDLSGQGQDARDRRNAVQFFLSSTRFPNVNIFLPQAAIADFIKSLAESFNVPGLSPRAITLFNQARSTSNFRWGKSSRSVAAACLAIALRESNRPDAIRDIASVLDVRPNSVAREFARIASALGLSLTLVDPSVHISTLHAHLSSALSGSKQPELSSSLSIPLGTLNLHSTTDTATALSYLLARLSPGHDILRLPVPATACAIFILALEAEHRAPLNPLNELAKWLGERFQVAKSVVMTRYKTIQDEVASWVENVPWLDKYEIKEGRAKVSKRLIVARGLKDVIQFQENIWQERTKPSLILNLVDEEQEHEEETGPSHPQHSRTGPNSSRALAQATRFLLDPLATPIVPFPSTSKFSNSQLSLATYLLATPSASIFGRVPSRLQLLATLRGGADEDKITDEELFTEGELEGLLRNENEIRTLRETFGWPEEEAKEDSETPPHKGKKRFAKVTEDGEADDILNGSAFRRKKTRLDMDALAQFMAKNYDGDEPYEGDSSLQLIGVEEVVNEAELQLGDKMDDDVEFTDTVFPSRRERPSNSMTLVEATAIASTSAVQDGELILDEWRPPSPESGLAFGDSRYEEEYD